MAKGEGLWRDVINSLHSLPQYLQVLDSLLCDLFSTFFPIFQGTTNLQLESGKNLHLKDFNKLKALGEFSRETELN